MDFDEDVYVEGMKKRSAGAMIWVAFPTLTPSEREFLKTGICDDCWNSM